MRSTNSLQLKVSTKAPHVSERWSYELRVCAESETHNIEVSMIAHAYLCPRHFLGVYLGRGLFEDIPADASDSPIDNRTINILPGDGN